MVKSKTRKANKSKKHIMTIPELRKAFEQIDIEVQKILSSHPINEKSIKEFQKAWKKIFYKSIDASTAESYLTLQKHMRSTKRKTRKSKQSGGVAPVDYTLRPGIDGTHGSYLPYVSSGLSFYDNINQIAMDADCGKIDITPKIDASMGSNMVKTGGQRIIAPTVPPSLAQDAQDFYLGKPLGNSPSVLDTQFKA